MPRGEHFRKVTDEQIVVQFDRAPRPVLTVGELQKLVVENEDVSISPEAIRKRLVKLKGDSVETEEIAGRTLWKRKGADVWATEGGFMLSLKDRLVVSGVAVALATGLLALFGLIASLAGNQLPVPLTALIGVWGLGFITASIVLLAFAWALLDIAKTEKTRRQKYGSDNWFRSWVGELLP